jgi:hypothetical protein
MTTFVYLLQQALPGLSEGGARTEARLRFAQVLVVVARWSKGLFVIFIIFGFHKIKTNIKWME